MAITTYTVDQSPIEVTEKGNGITSLTLPGNPVPAARPRLTRFNHAYNPKYKEMKAARTVINSQWKKEPINSPLGVDLEFHMPIPSSWSGKKRIGHKGKPHVCKPDLDNMVKFTLDAMNGIVFQDDSCVFSVIATKLYSDTPQTIIKVMENINGETSSTACA